jgi:hypothetical protein
MFPSLRVHTREICPEIHIILFHSSCVSVSEAAILQNCWQLKHGHPEKEQTNIYGRNAEEGHETIQGSLGRKVRWVVDIPHSWTFQTAERRCRSEPDFEKFLSYASQFRAEPADFTRLIVHEMRHSCEKILIQLWHHARSQAKFRARCNTQNYECNDVPDASSGDIPAKGGKQTLDSMQRSKSKNWAVVKSIFCLVLAGESTWFTARIERQNSLSRDCDASFVKKHSIPLLWQGPMVVETRGKRGRLSFVITSGLWAIEHTWHFLKPWPWWRTLRQRVWKYLIAYGNMWNEETVWISG